MQTLKGRTAIGFFVLLLFIAGTADAKNLGTFGQTFPIKEVDLRTFIQSRLAALKASGELTRYEQQAKERMALQAYRPKPLELRTEAETRTYFIDPSIQLTRPILNTDGRILVPAGTTVNPFKTVKLSETLIFFDGDSVPQVKWVMKHYPDYHDVKFILTGGDIREAAKRFGRIYFDQMGRLSQKLHIQNVPAVAEQAGLRWKITLIGRNDF